MVQEHSCHMHGNFRLGLSEVKVHYHKPRRFSDFSGRKEAANYCHEILSLQISKDHQNMSVEEKLNLMNLSSCNKTKLI